ncbi:MAG: hypothetical protein C5B43_00485 [Verrucomicrobia bacterium]|nr:MAG: hypothetical protein C5B43_00485 [Verrucomicrobiota bacterium]
MKNSKIVRKNNQGQISRHNNNILRGEGTPIPRGTVTKSNATNSNAINRNLALYGREMATITEKESNYVQQVNRAIEHRIKINIDFMNEVLFNNKKDVFTYNQNDTILNLASKSLEIFIVIRKCGLITKLQNHIKESTLGLSISSILEKNESLKGVNEEAYINGMFCWRVMLNVYEYEKKEFLNFEINYSKDDKDEVFIKEINSIINQTSKELKNIKREFFSIFRKLLDPNQKIESKLEVIKKYQPYFMTLLHMANCQVPESPQDNLFMLMGIFANSICKEISLLSNLIEILDKYKCAPKTLKISKEICQFLKNCFNEYKDLNLNPVGNPFLTNRFKIKAFLHELLKKMRYPINKEIIQNNILIHTQELNKKNNNIPQKEIGTQNIQNSSEKEFPDNNLSESIQNASVKIQEELNEAPNKNLEIEKEKQNNIIEISSNDVIEERIIEEEEDIEEEINGLMEVFCRYFEKDRVEKLKRKQEKLMNPKKTINNEDDKIIDNGSNIICTEIHLLNTEKQELVMNLFRKPLPPYRTILGSKVKSLITYLGGKAQGNEGNFQIYWNGSNKKAGDFEICHEGDTNGYLTPDYAKRVADAIYAGVIKYGIISKDYFTPELLRIIENHEVILVGQEKESL